MEEEEGDGKHRLRPPQQAVDSVVGSLPVCIQWLAGWMLCFLFTACFLHLLTLAGMPPLMNYMLHMGW